MKAALRKGFRPRWLAVLVLVAAAAIPAALVSTSGVHASSTVLPSNPAHPVVDASWIYSQDWYDATHFIYKRAGSDGCLPQATSCNTGGGTPGDSNNLPMNYNGTQEFNEWWAKLGVTYGPTSQNGSLGRFMNRRDHLFNQSSWQINVQELTLPGATCAGQQIMLAYHPDSQGVSAPNITTSSTPLSGMYSGSWGTGSAYDSNMGALMNLEEIGSVLRWHEVNGTYPARTLHSAVFDAELQGLIGSGQYSAAGTAATLLQAPTAVGDTNIKVASTTNLGVGTTIAMDEINTENPTVASVGTAAGTAGTLVLPSIVGDTNVKVSTVGGATVGQQYRVGNDPNPEVGTVATVGTAAGTAGTLTAPAAAGDTNVKVSTTSGAVVGQQYRVDVPPTMEVGTVATIGTAAATATTLAGPSAAGDNNIKVASTTGMTVGHAVRVDVPPNLEMGTVATVGTAQRTATTLAAASLVGDTNIKVASVTNMVAGEQVKIDTAANIEYGTIATVGTSGDTGTGVTLTAPLTLAHATGAAAQDLGTGVTLTAPLASAHALGAAAQDQGTGITLAAPLASAHAFGAASQSVGTGITLTAPLASAHAFGEVARALGTGITLTAPLTKAHPAGATVNGSATGLLSDSPQAQVVGVLNNDQNGINYPALHWGTDHYLNNLVGGGVGPWFNNINATPVSPAANNIYGTVGIQRLQHNLPAVIAFRTNVENAVTAAIADLGAKYNFSIPIGNPLMFKNTGSVPDNPSLTQTVPSYLPADQAKYTPVQDDRTGRTDQVSFGVRGIPSLGNIGVYDGNTDPLVGGNENPYPTSYPSKPNISFLYGQDTMSDYFSNLNMFAGGQVHGPGGFDTASEGLLRGVEFVATYFAYTVASPSAGGAVAKPNRPIAYYETTPRKPTAQTTISFDAGFSRRPDGKTDGLTYYWDFGDGSGLQMTSNPIIQHTFPTQAAWRDVKLLVGYGGKWGAFREAIPVDFFPTYYPAVAPATEPLPPTTGAVSDPCGVLDSTEMTNMVEAAKVAKHAPPTNVTLKDLANWATKTH